MIMSTSRIPPMFLAIFVAASTNLFGFLFFAEAAVTPKPVILDTDYGPFIDDIFALGLLVNSGDLLDLQYVLTTSEDPLLSAQCVAQVSRAVDQQERRKAGIVVIAYTLLP